MLPLFLLAVALPLPLPRVAAGGISCYDDAGQPVDWFLAYKLPRPRHSPPAEGMRYMYQDARSGGWVPGRALMNSTQSAVGRTLLQLYQGDSSGSLQPFELWTLLPVSPSVVLLDRAQGFWLLHKHPPLPAPHARDLRLAHSGLHNGALYLPGRWGREGRWGLWPISWGGGEASLLGFSSQALTASGTGLCVYLSEGAAGCDLYSGWVAQALSSDLYVQFWPNSRGVLPSNCSGSYRVYNIEELGFPAPGPHFSATVDHSKWCVSTEHAPGWACVGDMNRNLEEEQRGGGTLCQQDPAVWKSYCALVQSYSKC
uniref:Deoxyribonuclease-2-alpha n=1 Tax=Chelonoidis abingdonii TaxID=106734 RepID=A0A8C0G3X9_CHEAB